MAVTVGSNPDGYGFFLHYRKRYRDFSLLEL